MMRSAATAVVKIRWAGGALRSGVRRRTLCSSGAAAVDLDAPPAVDPAFAHERPSLEVSDEPEDVDAVIRTFATQSTPLSPSSFLREVMLYQWYVHQPAPPATAGAAPLVLFSSADKLERYTAAHGNQQGKTGSTAERTLGFSALWEAEQYSSVLLNPGHADSAFTFGRDFLPLLQSWSVTVDTEFVLSDLSATLWEQQRQQPRRRDDDDDAEGVVPTIDREVVQLLQDFEFYVLMRYSAGQQELISLPRDFNTPDPSSALGGRYVTLFTALDTVDAFRARWLHGKTFAEDKDARLAQVRGRDIFDRLASDENAGFEGVVVNCLTGLQTSFHRLACVALAMRD